MTGTDLESWLDGRQGEPPAALWALIRRYAAATDADGPLPDRLADAALAALQDVLASSGDRSSALTLLAADALLTYACEAALEDGAAELERVTARLDFDHFAELLSRQP